MRRHLLALAGVVTVLLAILYVALPVGHIPRYDANLVRLAESDLQGYCAGETFLRSEGMGSATKAAACRKRLAGKRPDKPDLPVVPSAFCAAIVDAGWEGTSADCLAIMSDNQLWPTYDGAITDQWNRARPYPQLLISSGGGPRPSGSRTGDRNGNERTNVPRHDMPVYP